MDRPDWAPEGIDIATPSIARSYDYLLSGSHNFAVDREYTRKIMAVLPDARLVARANRAFMHRAVRFMLAAGIRQFLDIGSGIPTVGNTHEIAQQVAPDTHVVYVDIDPVAVAHSRQILAGNDRATIIHEDLRRPEEIINHPDAIRLLDFGQPIGLLLVAILHAIPDENRPADLVASLRETLRPGSYVAIAHASDDSQPDEVGEVARLTKQTTTPVTMRSRPQIEGFFAGFDLVEPGVVWAPLWRPESPDEVDDQPERSSNFVGVGRKA
jgi:SAM-dependent methyltransferase